jgi:hypothetical protein
LDLSMKNRDVSKKTIDWFRGKSTGKPGYYTQRYNRVFLQIIP